MHHEASPESQHRLLVADDDPEVLGACDALFTQHGYAVTTCASSTDVIPRLKAGAYNTVVLDVRMPGLEGSDLLPLIKKLHPDLPVIIVSAYMAESDAQYYRELGAFETITKPFSHEVLLDAVARAVTQRVAIPLVLTSLSLREARDLVSRKLILSALRKGGWNQVRAAELLGISRYCLIRWLKKLQISY